MMDRTQYMNAMRAQTFGVEVEMNNITREQAARVAAKLFGTEHTVKYLGEGYYTWGCFDAQGRSWKFQRDVSIHGDDEHKCEMVTPVLHYEDMEMLQQLIRDLRHAGAKSSPSRGCGIHIHIGGDGHTPQSIRNLVNLMYQHEDQLIKGIGVAESRLYHYCQKTSQYFVDELNKKRPKTITDLSDCWYGCAGTSGYGHYDSSRYRTLNLHAFFHRYHTVEFRLFQFDEEGNGRKGGLHAGQLKAMIQLCLAMNQFAKTQKTIYPRKQQTNDMDAYRAWFTRIGLIGDEFKTCRLYLTRGFMTTNEWRHSDEHRTTMVESGRWAV